MKFNWIDILVAFFIVRGIIVGHRRGFSGELLHFVGIVCALYLSFRFYNPLAGELIQRVTMDRNIANGLAFTGIFLVVIFFFYMINQTARGMMQLPVVAALEKAGGALLGGAQAFLFASALLVLLALVNVESISTAVSRDSFFGPIAITTIPRAYHLAVRVSPEVQSPPVEEAIKKLPGVSARTDMDFLGTMQKPKEQAGGEPASAPVSVTRPKTKGKSR